jgi:hypothetical protein
MIPHSENGWPHRQKSYHDGRTTLTTKMSAKSSAVDVSLTNPTNRQSVATLVQLADGTWVKQYSDGSVISTHIVYGATDPPVTRDPSAVAMAPQPVIVPQPVMAPQPVITPQTVFVPQAVIAPHTTVQNRAPVYIAPPVEPEPSPPVPVVNQSSQVEPPRTLNLKVDATVPLESQSGYTTAGTNTTMYRTSQGKFAAHDLVMGRAPLESDLDFSLKNAPGMTQNADTIVKDEVLQSSAMQNLAYQLGCLILAWYLGHNGWNGIWIVGLFAVSYYFLQLNLAKLAGTLRMDSTRAMRIERLDTDVESIEWLNTLLDRYWLHYEPYLSNNLKNSLNATLGTVNPPMVQSLQIVEFTLGTSPPRFDAIKTFKRGVGDVVEYVLRIAYFPLSEEELAARKIASEKKEAVEQIKREHAKHMDQALSVQELERKLHIIDQTSNTNAAVESIPVTKRGLVGKVGDQFSKLGRSFRPTVVSKPAEPAVPAAPMETVQDAADIAKLKRLLKDDVLYDTPLILFKELEPEGPPLTIDVTERDRLARRELRAETRASNQMAVQDPRNAKIVLEVVLRVGLKVTIPIAVENVLLDGAIVIKMQFGGGFPHMKKLWVSLPVDGTTTQVILPALDFELKPLMAFDLLDVPGLSSWLMNTIRSQIAAKLGPPGMMIDMQQLGNYPSLPDDAIGLLHLKIVKARNFVETLVGKFATLDRFDSRGGASNPTVLHAFTKHGAQENLETMKRGLNQTLHLKHGPTSVAGPVIKLGCRVVLGGTMWPGKVVGSTKFVVGIGAEPEWNCDLKILVPRSCLTEAHSDADLLTVWIFADDAATSRPVAKLEGLKVLEWLGTKVNPKEAQRDRLVRLIKQRAWADAWGPPDPDRSRAVWKSVALYDPDGRFGVQASLGSVLVRAEYWSMPTPQERAAAETELEKAKHAARVKAYNEASKETDVDPVTVAELAGELAEEATREGAGRGVPYGRQSGVLRITIHQAKNLQDYSLLTMPTMKTDKSNVVTKAFGGVVNVVGATANVVAGGLESLVIGSYSPYVVVRMRDVDPNDESKTAFTQHLRWQEENGLIAPTHTEVVTNVGNATVNVPSPQVSVASNRVLTLGRLKIPMGKQTAPAIQPLDVEADDQQGQIIQTTGTMVTDPSLVYQTEPKFRAVNPTFDEYCDLYISDLKSQEFEIVVKVMSESGVAEKDLGRVWIRAWQAVERGQRVWFKLKGVKSGMICLSFTFTPVTMDVSKEVSGAWDGLSDAPDFAQHRVNAALAL